MGGGTVGEGGLQKMGGHSLYSHDTYSVMGSLDLGHWTKYTRDKL